MQTELGDPNFVDIDASRFTDPGMNAQADLSGTGPASGDPDSSAPNTTHLVVVDEDGLTVSMTNTVTDFWGSGQGVDGYFMNNALLRFDTFDSEQNQPEPGRRSATWSNPTTVLDEEGRPIMPIGTPGRTDPARDRPRPHPAIPSRLQPPGGSGCSPFPGRRAFLYLEEGHDEELYEELAQEGWEPEQWDAASFGSVQLLEIDYETGELTGAEDSRRDGSFSILE